MTPRVPCAAAGHRLRRRGCLIVCCMLLCMLGASGGVAAALDAAPTRASSLADEPPASVIIVGVPGLHWQDVDALTTPHLTQLAADGSTAALSVRSARSRTCPGDAWVQLGTGNRARAPQLDTDTFAQRGLCPEPPDVRRDGIGAQVPSWSQVVAENEALTFGTEPGSMADALNGAGVCTTAIGPHAPLATADSTGATDLWQPLVADVGQATLAACPVTVVGTDALIDGVARGDLAAVDQLVGTVDRVRPSGSLLIVIGLSEVLDEPSSLHVAIAIGPGFGPGNLVSSSTRRPPFVQLSDVAPTVLDALGLPQPNAMTYRPWLPAELPRAGSVADAIDELVELDEQAQHVGRLIPTFFLSLVLTQAALYLLGYLALRRVSSAVQRRWVLTGTHVLAVAYASGPVATFLANLVPWWRTDHPLVSVLAAVFVAGATVTTVAFLGPWRRHPFGPSGAVALITAVVLAADVTTGARLQLSSLAGYSPIVAGRFAGFGNLAFAVFGAAALLAAAAAVSGRSRRYTVIVVTCVGVLAVVIDGSPTWGSDFGGVIALVPAFAVLGITASGSKVSWRSLLATVALGCVVVGVISLLDYLRPEADRTHLGRFVAQVIDGSAGIVVHRKLEANLNLLTNSVLTLLVPLALVFVAFLIRRPRGLLPWTFERIPTLRAGLTAVLVLGIVGGLVNDSGIAIPVMAATLVIPIAIAVVAASLNHFDEQPPDGSTALSTPPPPASSSLVPRGQPDTRR